ncbi:hypothetical protein HK098_003179 [Nowakowskiella sp. JEL0407]|nr:hypothetical protein HK098_003179 [Nowakowskiella sp. JEL0407]
MQSICKLIQIQSRIVEKDEGGCKECIQRVLEYVKQPTSRFFVFWREEVEFGTLSSSSSSLLSSSSLSSSSSTKCVEMKSGQRGNVLGSILIPVLESMKERMSVAGEAGVDTMMRIFTYFRDFFGSEVNVSVCGERIVELVRIGFVDGGEEEMKRQRQDVYLRLLWEQVDFLVRVGRVQVIKSGSGNAAETVEIVEKVVKSLIEMYCCSEEDVGCDSGSGVDGVEKLFSSSLPGYAVEIAVNYLLSLMHRILSGDGGGGGSSKNQGPAVEEDWIGRNEERVEKLRGIFVAILKNKNCMDAWKSRVLEQVIELMCVSGFNFNEASQCLQDSNGVAYDAIEALRNNRWTAPIPQPESNINKPMEIKHLRKNLELRISVIDELILILVPMQPQQKVVVQFIPVVVMLIEILVSPVVAGDPKLFSYTLQVVSRILDAVPSEGTLKSKLLKTLKELYPKLKIPTRYLPQITRIMPFRTETIYHMIPNEVFQKPWNWLCEYDFVPANNTSDVSTSTKGKTPSNGGKNTKGNKETPTKLKSSSSNMSDASRNAEIVAAVLGSVEKKMSALVMFHPTVVDFYEDESWIGGSEIDDGETTSGIGGGGVKGLRKREFGDGGEEVLQKKIKS